MIRFAPCKINLGLHVTEKRPDGYHHIETCFVPVPWFDVIEAIPASAFGFTASGLPVPGAADDNLCVRAYRLLQKDFSLPPAALHLHKTVPMGAGLGGGSSNGAGMLCLLNDLFALGLTDENLRHYAAQLGSDCPFFIGGRPMLGTGRGEVLTPVALPLAGCGLAVVKPDVHVSTAEAYAGITPRKPVLPLAEVLNMPVARWREALVNDFEATVAGRFPVIGRIKNELYDMGAFYAALSGSGSAVFGLFDREPDVAGKFDGCLCWSGRLSL
jgi:4-diphosphocytidyl-2-C-methyl-D-erythritol kinase